MALLPFYHVLSFLEKSASSPYPSILAVVPETEVELEDRSFSPRLLVSRLPPSAKSAEKSILPIPAAVSAFNIPRLPYSGSTRSFSLRSRNIPRLESSKSLLRPKSVPIFQHEWSLDSVGSLRSRSTLPGPMYNYRPSQPQPDPRSLPPVTSPTLSGNWLKTEAERDDARKRRQVILAASKRHGLLPVPQVVQSGEGGGEVSTEKTVVIAFIVHSWAKNLTEVSVQ